MGCSLPPFAWRQPVDPGRRADRQRRDGFSTNHFAAYRRGQPGLLGELYSGPLAGNTRTVQNWLSHLPAHYHQRAHHLFHKHGLSALLIGRFIAFVRTLLPTIAGISGLNNARFQFFNWMSGLLWVLILTSLGYLLGKTPVFMKYEDQLMSCLMLLPVVLLFLAWRVHWSCCGKRSMGAGDNLCLNHA